MRVSILMILLLATPVYANSGWTDFGGVLELVPTIHHRFRVKLDVDGNRSGCKDKQWFYQDYDRAGAREMYLALLEAVSSEKSVKVYVTGRCDINDYAEISEISIRP